MLQSPEKIAEKASNLHRNCIFTDPLFLCLVSLESGPGCPDWSDCARKMMKSCSQEGQKLAKNCQNSKTLLPKFQKLLPKCLDIFM